MDGQEWASENEISNVTSVMKMWLRELPEPLLTYGLHQGFIEAASLSLFLIFPFFETESFLSRN